MSINLPPVGSRLKMTNHQPSTGCEDRAVIVSLNIKNHLANVLPVSHEPQEKSAKLTFSGAAMKTIPTESVDVASSSAELFDVDSAAEVAKVNFRCRAVFIA